MNTKCSNCGSEVESGNNFCSNCGLDLRKEYFKICDTKKNTIEKRFLIVAASVLITVILIVVVIALPRIKNEIDSSKQYKEALAHLEAEQYSEAVEEFQKLEGYKNSKAKLLEAYYKMAENDYENRDFARASEHYLAASEFKDAKEKYVTSTYEYGKLLIKNYDYVLGAKEFEKIDYEDSKELAQLYIQFDKDRYHNEKFYYFAEEYTDLLNTLLQEENKNYAAKLEIDQLTEIPIIKIYDGKKFVGVYAYLVNYNKDEGAFSGVMMHWESVSETENNVGAATYIYNIALLDLSLSHQEANDFYLDFVDNASGSALLGIYSNQKIKNEIEYSFSYSSTKDSSEFSIGAPIDE